MTKYCCCIQTAVQSCYRDVVQLYAINLVWQAWCRELSVIVILLPAL